MRNTLNVNKYAYYDESDRQYYASEFWFKLIAILDLPQHQTKKVTLDEMVKYTQERCLRPKDQRWALENQVQENPVVKEQLEKLLQDIDQVEEQPFPKESKYALFLGTSTVNLCKRAFYLYDNVVRCGAKIENIVVLGNSEPYDRFLNSINEVVATFKTYFRDDLSSDDVPTQATMHEVMLFLLNNFKWPDGKKPNVISLSQPHPCNTTAEVAKFVEYVSSHQPTPSSATSARSSEFFQQAAAEKKAAVVAVASHQPFNDRQAITALNGIVRANMQDQFSIIACGPGMNTYPVLNTYPASSMSLVQLVDNLSRTLYEIQQNAEVLLMRSVRQVCSLSR